MLITEDGTGKTDSESYISIADAEVYLTNFGDTSWAAAEDADKEVACRKATRYLDLMYGNRWLERRTNDTQALDWPRADLDDKDGYVVESDEIPVNIQRATAEMALLALTEDILPDVATGNQSISREAKKAGPISKDVSYVGTKAELKRYSKVHAMVREFIRPFHQALRG